MPSTEGRTVNPDSGISARAFFVVAASVVVLVFAVIWFSIPGADTRHTLRSPSGKALLEIGEVCGAESCDRRLVFERTGADGSKTRTGCPIDIAGNQPAFATVNALWADDETSILLDYADATGKRGSLTVTPEIDCTEI